MKLPHVPNVMRDEERNITYTVMAYRQMTRAEVVRTINDFHSRKGHRRRTKGAKYKIFTTYGARD